MYAKPLQPYFWRPTTAPHSNSRRLWLAMLICVLSGVEAPAQLAITEVMSWASTNCSCCLTQGPRNADFWELTNFGTNQINLNGYQFVDRDGSFPAGAWPLPSINIEGGESIIFVREGQNIFDPAGFREWWGATNLPPNLQIICCYYGRIGFDEKGDAVRLFDPDSNEVDHVYFGESQSGFTFDYDTETGAACQSANCLRGAFRAATCDDVGSPGWAMSGPVALKIMRQPVSQTNKPGSDVTFSVQAQGLPRPRYQWYFNGSPIPNPGGFAVPRLVCFAGCGPAWTERPPPSDLVIANVQPSHAGEYFVEVFNGLERLTSAVVRLIVNTNLLPLRFECPPAPACLPDAGESMFPALAVTLDQTATFKVMACGYPPPTFQWSWSADGANFVEMPGATDPTLDIFGAQPMDAGIYRVQVLQDPNSLTNLFVQLFVKTNALLKITEAMSDECSVATNAAATDWWEVTNIGNEPVNLCGYRWDDGPGNIGAGPSVTNPVIVQPGESVIFLEGRTPESFIRWWGVTNLPPALQIITYTANGLELEGDEIEIWNPTADNDRDYVDSVDFSTVKTRGASFWFDTFVCLEPPDPAFPNLPGVRLDTPSVEGECGAFRAAQGCEVGSPGWTRWTPPRLTSIRRDGPNVILEWKAQPGSTNLVQYTSNLAPVTGGTNWMALVTTNFMSASCTAIDTTVAADPQRFYRVCRVSPAPCDCPVP